jgi:two-component system, LytTR family, response regulator
MIKCIAIDDEPIALEVVKQYVAQIPMVDLTDTFTDAIQALSWLKTHQTDLIILDINMPDISGIQLIKSLPTKQNFIFTTAFSEYAVNGFELEAIDYLVKPFTFERLMTALLKVKKVIGIKDEEREVIKEHIFVKSEYYSVKINLDEILYIEGLDDYIKIYLKNSKPVLSLMSLKAILEKIPKEQFMRVHRSFIVPLRSILSIRNKRIYLDQREIPIGDTYLESVKGWLSARKGNTP